VARLTSTTQLERTNELVILPRDAGHWTGEDDPLHYYYRPLTARLYRARLALVGRLLGPGPFDALLDAGYGSGIFLPELARRANRVVGIDVHDEPEQVRASLAPFGVDAELHTGSVLELPFDSGSFDAVVCASVLEHLRDLDRALGEFRRVLRAHGVVVLGFPVRNPVTDVFFRVFGYDPREIHPSSHSDILSASERAAGLRVEQVARLPWFAPLAFAAYVGVRLRAV
jgi:SAM-dependent methyltransferase